MTEIPDELIRRLNNPTEHGFTAAELELLGVEWPPTKGWRKRLLRERKGRQIREAGPWPTDTDGYLVRRTRTGKVHHFANGQALCRSVSNQTKYEFVSDCPSGVPMCSVCEALLVSDPCNQRESEGQQRGFYASWGWKALRYEVLKIYGPECMLCRSTYRPVVDHIKPRSLYPELAMEITNLQVLCNECNMGKGNHDETDFRPSDWRDKLDGIDREAEMEISLSAQERGL